jgi:DNA invertase Pin-like site-specific DNA recombinase
MPRLAIYARQSVPEDQGIAQQVAEIREALERLGWSEAVVDIYPDNDVSGSTFRDGGTQWARMIRDIQAGRVDTVAVVAPDRLTRNLADLVLLRDSARVVTARGGIDTADPSGFGAFMLAQVVLMAEQEIRTKNARVEPYKHARHARGVPTPGRVPYGYRWIPKGEREQLGDLDARYAVVPEEAEVVRYMFREALGMVGSPKGIELGSIARQLNAGEAKTASREPLGDYSRTTRTGKPWGVSTVRRTLISPYYAALLPPIDSLAERPKMENGKPAYWHAERVDLDACIPGHWEPIIQAGDGHSPLDVVRIVRGALLDVRRRTNGGKVSRKWLLSGLARCGKTLGEHVEHDDGTGYAETCGAPVRSGWTREGHRGYKCPRGHFHMRAEALDAWAVETLLERLTRPDAASLLRPAPEVDVPGLQTRAKSLEARRAELTALVASGRRTFAEIAPHDDEIAAELGTIRDALAEAYSADPLADVLDADNVRAYWEGLSLSRQRAVLASLYEPIIAPPGHGWKVVTGEPRGRQVSVSQVARPAWRRVAVTDEGNVSRLTNAARQVLAVSA